ncbi:hypothetical protein LMH73_015680 [Vibrio splendidus]|nr:hypothetical protein [Vibrio splendidus]MCC4881471.1 hypothetical protein [Vibrio splendidus]
MHWLFWDIENTGNSKVLHYWGRTLDTTSLVICGSSKIPVPREITENKNSIDYLEMITFKEKRKDKADDFLVRSLITHIESGDISHEDTVYILSNDRGLNQRFVEVCEEHGVQIDLKHTSNIWDALMCDVFILKAAKTIETNCGKKSEVIHSQLLKDMFKGQAPRVIRELAGKGLLISISKKQWKLNLSNVEKKLFRPIKAKAA